MVSVYDYLIIGLFLAFMAATGWIFKRLNHGATDYFAGGFRMTWWLLGASSFISNMSCWSFTGAANMAWKYGVLIFGFYFADVLSYAISFLWFAPRFRQLRLVTAMDAVRLRFGAGSEQFFNWLGFINAMGIASVWMVSMGVILSSAFQLPPVPVLVTSGVVIVLIALLGGNWAVVASDFVQLVVLLGVTIVVAFLTIVKIGGVGAFLAQIPETHWQLFHPTGAIPYDWLYLVTYAGTALYMKNSVVVAGKYIAAKDSRHARWSALVPMFAYILMPVLWMVPPFAAFTLVPDLATKSFMTTPGEASYIAVCLQVLPQGMIGLLIVCMIGATTAATDVALNKNAGMFVRNFYRPILRPAAGDFEQVVVGKIATVVFGVTITTIALLVVTRSKVSLFDAYLYLGAYLGVPLAVPLFMGMLLRRVPRWAGWGTALFGMLVTTFIYVFLPSETGRALCEPWLGAFAYGYAVANKFVMTSLVTAPLTTLFFWGTRVFYREPRDERAAGEVREFFRRLDTPVDFEREVGQDNSALQARLIGRLACTYGGFVALMVFVPNPLLGRLSILACSLVPLGVGTALLRYARRQDARKAAAAPECLPAVQNAG
jgi:Na+/proline symporter